MFELLPTFAESGPLPPLVSYPDWKRPSSFAWMAFHNVLPKSVALVFVTGFPMTRENFPLNVRNRTVQHNFPVHQFSPLVQSSDCRRPCFNLYAAMLFCPTQHILYHLFREDHHRSSYLVVHQHGGCFLCAYSGKLAKQLLDREAGQPTER